MTDKNTPSKSSTPDPAGVRPYLRRYREARAKSERLFTSYGWAHPESPAGRVLERLDNNLSKAKTALRDKLENPMSRPPVYKHGGMVRKTGLAKVHKGERVLTRSQAKSFKRR